VIKVAVSDWPSRTIYPLKVLQVCVLLLFFIIIIIILYYAQSSTITI